MLSDYRFSSSYALSALFWRVFTSSTYTAHGDPEWFSAGCAYGAMNFICSWIAWNCMFMLALMSDVSFCALNAGCGGGVATFVCRS